MNWKETPVKPFWVEKFAWSMNDYHELMSRHRHRQRIFVQFLEHFVGIASNVSKLIMPFDWSSRSLHSLSQLKNLHTLVLEKYFVFQALSQSSLDELFTTLPDLKRLILEIWTPSGKGLQFYNVDAPNLVYLDVSQSRGFYLKRLNLPSLEVFKVARHPWTGPLTCVDTLDIPCVYTILVEGAPALKQLNEHLLKPEWKSEIYSELETVLNSVCSCRKHKSGWAM